MDSLKLSSGSYKVPFWCIELSWHCQLGWL